VIGFEVFIEQDRIQHSENISLESKHLGTGKKERKNILVVVYSHVGGLEASCV
jgi:hypothetical protein